MKTKHLFLATALMASFAACTNEEIVSDVQQNVATGRPTVENVKLTFGEGVDSRLIYNKGWKWEATDQIGALLMDQPANLPSNWNGTEAWAEKYNLTATIHTSYPFSYDTEEGTWGTPGKMLEGNYFFAYPWESYEGQRQVTHSLINQKQNGITADVRAESYANNQFFIGYDRIVAGTQAEEALNNVEMTSILGAVELRIINTGTQTYNINKVVLSGTKLASQLTFDPTNAEYKLGTTYYNLADKKSFNSANYLELDDEKIYNADKYYEKVDALSKVVQSLPDENNDNFAQIIIEGEERALLPDAENTAYVLIMANPFEVASSDDLFLSIYTDEGMVGNIDLTKINKSSMNKYGYVTDAKIKEIHPLVKNVIEVQLDDNAFETPDEMEIYNTQDLEQFIAWNAQISGKREVTAILNKNVTLTETAYEALIGKDNMELTITSATNGEKTAVLTLAAELPVDVLDYENLNLAALTFSRSATVTTYLPNVKALCDLELTKDSEIPAHLEMAEGTELTIDQAKPNKVNITNYGTLTIGAKADIKSATGNKIVNKGTMTVAEGADVRVEVINEKELEVAGYVSNVSLNDEDAVITMEETADLTVADNDGEIYTAEDSELNVTDNANGKIKYEDGAVAVIGTNKGMIYREISGEKENEVTTGTNPSPVNTWVVVDNVEFEDHATIATMIVKDGADITVAANKILTVTNLTIEGATTTEGTIQVAGPAGTDGKLTAGMLVVEEDADLDNQGTITGLGIFQNYGFIDSNDNISFDIAGYELESVKGEYKGDITFDESVAVVITSFDDALEAAVMAWIDTRTDAEMLWSEVTAANIADVTKNDWTHASKATSEKSWNELATALVQAYNAMKEEENGDVDFADLTLSKENVKTILTESATATKIASIVGAAKSEASETVKAAVTAAITNKDLTINWKEELGYAYVNNVADYAAMWTAYSSELKAKMAGWTSTVNNVKGYHYKNHNGVLKGSLLLAINAETVEKVYASQNPTLDTPAGSFIDASNNNAEYQVISYFVNNVNGTTVGGVGSAWTYTLANIKKYMALLNNDELTDSDLLAGKTIVGSHITTVLGWDDLDPVYSQANLDALKVLVKADKVTTLTNLQDAILASPLTYTSPIIDLNGSAIEVGETNMWIERDVTIKNGTIIGAQTYVKGGKNVVFDNVTFKNAATSGNNGSAIRTEDSQKTGNITIKNCKFDGFQRDAIQINSPADGKTITVDGNTFVAPMATNAEGSYLTISALSETYTAKIIVKNNTFGALDKFGDNPIKIYGMKKFDQVIVGGNTFGTAYNASADVQQVYVATGETYNNNVPANVKVYNKENAYNAFKGSLAKLNNAGE